VKYDEFFSSPLGRKILEREAEYVAKYASGTIASVGCGTGKIEERIEEISGEKIIGVEIDDEMLAVAKDRIDVIKASATALPFKNASLDAIIFITSLEFIEDYRKAIEESYRVLKAKGKIIAILLNTSSQYFKRKYEAGGYIRKYMKHFDVDSIQDYIKIFFNTKVEGLFEIVENELYVPGKSVYGVIGIKEA